MECYKPKVHYLPFIYTQFEFGIHLLSGQQRNMSYLVIFHEVLNIPCVQTCH